MIVRILVTAHIGWVDIHAGAVPTARKLRASACKAIENAVALGADTGFEHELSGVTSIAVESVTLAGARHGSGASKRFSSWVEAAENIPAGDIWKPRIVYDQRPEGWHWRDGASDDDWKGPHATREVAAKTACEHNDFHPRIRLKNRPGRN